MKMEAGVAIQTFTSRTPFQYPGGHLYIAEDLCISIAKSLHIGPTVRHLFGLWWPEASVWLSPCREIDTCNGQKWVLAFKLRFKPPSMQRFSGMKDPEAFDYYFRQMRNDFLSDCIPEMLQHKNKNRALGLAATDMIREMLEKKLNVDDMKNCYREFLPRDIWKKHRIWLKQPLIDAVERGLTNSQQNLEYVKGQYMSEVCSLVPDYGSEQYTAQVDEDGQVWQVTLHVDPYNAQQPGLRQQIKSSKGKWAYVCSIADLYYISIRNDGTVELSRRNGIPKYFRFESIDMMHSFVSCLDGYYRLMEKWTFNLCKELPTPSLLELRALKCHGPVGYQFSCAKLKEKRNNSAGSFIIRESSSSYDEFRVDWYCSFEKRVLTVRVERNEEGHFIRIGDDQTFPTLPQLLSYMSKNHLREPLAHCVPVSEYDKTLLLLCRPDDQKEKEKVLSECPCTNKCILAEEIIFHKEREVQGHFCSAIPGQLKRSKGDLPVMVKALSYDVDGQKMQNFLKQCSQILHWHCEAIISTLGVILFNPLGLVMEHLPLGSLDKYLQHNRNKVQKVDLVEAASYLARALWYLEEHRCVHGKLRCRNILVSCHTENSFKVKLADPGLLIYSCLDTPWIPPECYSNYSSAALSTSADVWAFGTTLWEIFSYGESPALVKNQMVPVDGSNPVLDPPKDCHQDVVKLMLECWAPDPDNRKQPQAAMRDINQTLYEVYNSRRSNSYATVYPPQISQLPIVPNCNNTHQLQQHKTMPVMPRHNSIFKSAMHMVLPGGNNNNSYDQISSYSSSSEQSIVTVLTEIYPGEGCVPVGQLVSFGSCDSVCQEPACGDPQIPLDSHWVIDFSHLTMGQILGQGFYGEVCKATLTQWAGLKEETVAVKRIKKSVLSEAGLRDLLREIDIMKNLRHPNIVEIKGLVEEPQPMLVMEYLELGSLLAHLQMYNNKLSTNLLLKFTTDIAQGMWYLEGKHIVHRDLAARNILVASQSQVKISDFGLAQFTENHYYRVKTERNLPIRWYSPESINFGKFSHKSDVWSYGVTLWEMFSFGENPAIPGVSDTKLAKALESGQRLSCPQHCPLEVYRLMGSCWQLDSHIRPSFYEILQQLEVLNNDMND